ncbi:MAG: RNA polymerase sigma factor [Rhodospirillaceae bacterium]|nr:RNA polymerase sigma factor [Rhodospirillaceae bacterium]
MAESVDPISDADLMRRVAGGDQSATRTVVGRHLPQVLTLARRMLRDAAEAEDVAQESMLRLWQMAPRWRADAPIGAWLYRVAHNLAIDRLRRRRPTVDVDSAIDLADPAPTPAERLAERERKAAVDRAIAALPERQRTAITLVHTLEMGNIEAAAAMEISVEALESLLARGRRALRTALVALKDEVAGE